MRQQNYNNHIRFYPPHHFVFYPVMMVLIVLCSYKFFNTTEDRSLWGMITVLLLLVTWLSYMTRQHYALTLQNRIVLLEMRFRYHSLTNLSFNEIEQKLSFGQIAALRFASDEELQNLTQKAVEENLSPKVIKRSIKNWKADNNRV